MVQNSPACGSGPSLAHLLQGGASATDVAVTPHHHGTAGAVGPRPERRKVHLRSCKVRMTLLLARKAVCA